MSKFVGVPHVVASEAENRDQFYVDGNLILDGWTRKEQIRGSWHSSARTPGFKTFAKSSLPENYFLSGAILRRDHGGTATSLDGRYKWTGSARTWFPHTWDALGGYASYSAADAESQAENAAMMQASNMKMNVAQSMAERAQTANLLVNTVNRLVTFAVLAKKGKFSEANKVLRARNKLFQPTERFRKDSAREITARDFPNLWLEYSYGWRPLLSDIHGAAELLADSFARRRPTVCRGKASTRHQINDISTVTYGDVRITGAQMSEASCKLRFEVEDATRDLLTRTGIANPALLAWELLPYSFVVDWVYPVGNFLKAAATPQGLNFLGGSVSCVTRVNVSSGYIKTRGYNLAGFRCDEKTVVMERRLLSGFPINLPQVQLDLNLSQVTSALSLFSQVFRPKSDVVFNNNTWYGVPRKK